jgi:hypothetical protein
MGGYSNGINSIAICSVQKISQHEQNEMGVEMQKRCKLLYGAYVLNNELWD